MGAMVAGAGGLRPTHRDAMDGARERWWRGESKPTINACCARSDPFDKLRAGYGAPTGLGEFFQVGGGGDAEEGGEDGGEQECGGGEREGEGEAGALRD